MTIKIKPGETLFIIHQYRICNECGEDAVTQVTITSPTKPPVIAFLCERHTDELARRAIDCGATLIKRFEGGDTTDSNPIITA